MHLLINGHPYKSGRHFVQLKKLKQLLLVRNTSTALNFFTSQSSHKSSIPGGSNVPNFVYDEVTTMVDEQTYRMRHEATYEPVLRQLLDVTNEKQNLLDKHLGAASSRDWPGDNSCIDLARSELVPNPDNIGQLTELSANVGSFASSLNSSYKKLAFVKDFQEGYRIEGSANTVFREELAVKLADTHQVFDEVTGGLITLPTVFMRGHPPGSPIFDAAFKACPDNSKHTIHEALMEKFVWPDHTHLIDICAQQPFCDTVSSVIAENYMLLFLGVETFVTVYPVFVIFGTTTILQECLYTLTNNNTRLSIYTAPKYLYEYSRPCSFLLVTGVSFTAFFGVSVVSSIDVPAVCSAVLTTAKTYVPTEAEVIIIAQEMARLRTLVEIAKAKGVLIAIGQTVGVIAVATYEQVPALLTKKTFVGVLKALFAKTFY